MQYKHKRTVLKENKTNANGEWYAELGVAKWLKLDIRLFFLLRGAQTTLISPPINEFLGSDSICLHFLNS